MQRAPFSLDFDQFTYIDVAEFYIANVLRVLIIIRFVDTQVSIILLGIKSGNLEGCLLVLAVRPAVSVGELNGIADL